MSTGRRGVYLSRELYEKASKLAEERDVSLSALIRGRIEDVVETKHVPIEPPEVAEEGRIVQVIIDPAVAKKATAIAREHGVRLNRIIVDWLEGEQLKSAE